MEIFDRNIHHGIARAKSDKQKEDIINIWRATNYIFKKKKKANNSRIEYSKKMSKITKVQWNLPLRDNGIY